MNKLLIPTAIALLANSCTSPKDDRPNILFVLMDDLGYGHFAPNNDTLKLSNLDPYFVSVVNADKYEPGPPRHKPLERIEKYSPEEAIEFSKKATPTLTKMAREGIVFSSAFACNNLSAPSRAGLATGMYPSHFGIYNNPDVINLGLRPGMLLAEKFHDLGYATAHIGKWHIGHQDNQIVLDALKRHGIEDTLGFNQVERKFPEIYKEISDSGYLGSVIDKHNPLQNGFDYYFGYNYWGSQFYNSTIVWENYKHAAKQKNYNTDVFTDTALSFIRKQVKLKKPFYVQLFYHAVHDSLKPKAPDKYFNRFNSESYDLNNFYAHMFAVDENIKKIIEYLESNGALKNTIIVFTSDNGAQSGGPSVLPGNSPFPGHKGTYFQGGVRIPLFFYWPDKIKPGLKSNLLVSHVDIIPTLIDAAGGEITDSIDGKSLLPIMTQQSTEPVHEYLYWAGLHSRYFGFLLNKTFVNEAGSAPYSWAIVKDDYLLRFVGTMVPDVYTDFPDGRQPVYELYNIKNDPSEKHNIIEDMPDKANELKLLYYSRAKNFPPPPFARDIGKWEEILPPKN